mgnify:FL=1
MASACRPAAPVSTVQPPAAPAVSMIAKGDRVQLTAIAKYYEVSTRLPDRCGTVVRIFGSDPTLARVLWDGRTTLATWEVRYLEPQRERSKDEIPS